MGINLTIYWLVVSNIFLIFHYIWDVILPIDFHIFQRGRSTTNQIYFIKFHYQQLRHPRKSPKPDIPSGKLT